MKEVRPSLKSYFKKAEFDNLSLTAVVSKLVINSRNQRAKRDLSKNKKQKARARTY
jgi:hypothetical protein